MRNGNVIDLRHTRASSRRAAKLARRSADTSASRAFSVSRIDDHRSGGIQSRCHHFVTMPADAPISDASASRAPWASLAPQSSMTERNDVICDMPPLLGQFVLKCKDPASLDGEMSLGHTVRMAPTDEKELFKQQFVDRAKRARASTGKKQWEIALAMGVEQDEYKHWEGKRLMPHHLIARFCLVCQVDPIWMLTGHGKMKGTPAPQPVELAEQPTAVAKPKRRRAKRAA